MQNLSVSAVRSNGNPEAVAAASAAFMNDFMAFFMALTFPPARAAR